MFKMNKKLVKKSIIGILLMSSIVTYAQVLNSGSGANLLGNQSLDQALQASAMDFSHINPYQVPTLSVVDGQIILKRSDIVKIDDKGKLNFQGTIILERDDVFTVMASKIARDGSRLILIGVNSDIAGEPNSFWIHESALNSARLEVIQDFDDGGEVADNEIGVDDDQMPIAALLNPDESELGEYVETQVAGQSYARKHYHGKRHRRGGKGGMPHCLRSVRITLATMNICHSNSFGDHASAAYGQIEGQCGMTPAKYSASLPVGSVCIMSGGNHICREGKHRVKCGDAMIKLGTHTWKGADVRPTPVRPNHGYPRCLVPRKAS